MFDRYVQGTKPSWKRRAVLIASLGAHGLAAVVLTVYSFIHVEEITPPALSLTFFSAPPPPPPPPPPAKHHTETKHIEKMVQPTQIPQLVQPKEEPKEEDSGEDDGVEGGVEGGVKGGTVGGVVGGVLGGQGPPQKPKNVPWAKIQNEVIHKIDPHLPAIVINQRRGTGDAAFLAKICVDTGGNVTQVTVMQSIPGADADIISTLRQWKWKPQQIPICFVNRWLFTIN